MASDPGCTADVFADVDLMILLGGAVGLLVLGAAMMAMIVRWLGARAAAAQLAKEAAQLAERRRRRGPLKVLSVHVYPLKSGAALAGVDEVRVDWLGFELDREWMVVDTKTKEFVSQRQLPKMSLIVPTLTAGGTIVELRAPGMPDPLRLPVGRKGLDPSDTFTALVWDDVVETQNVEAQVPGASAWLCDYLGKDDGDLALVRSLARDDHSRPLPRKHAVKAGLAGDASDPVQARLQDGFPLLVTTTASLREVNRRLARAGAAQLCRSRDALQGSRVRACARLHGRRRVLASTLSLHFLYLRAV